MKNKHILACIFLSIFCLVSNFLFGQAPTITSFSPTKGDVGTTIVITGTNFNAVASNNIVYFGATKAAVTIASATSLTVTVPFGATYSPISVLNISTSLLTISKLSFMPTFSPNVGHIKDYDFDTKMDIATGYNPASVAMSDMDGDGWVDLLSANVNGFTVSVLKNTTINNNMSFANKIEYTTGSYPKLIITADIDNDGKPDILVANSGSASISVLRNVSTIGNINFEPKVDFSVGSNTQSMSIGDFDKDGKLDIASVGKSDSNLIILRNTSLNGSISFAAPLNFETPKYPTYLSVGDIDGDSKLDVLIYKDGYDSLVVYRNTTISGISFAPRISLYFPYNSSCLLIADIDGDEKKDILAAINYPYSLTFIKNISVIGNIHFNYPINYKGNVVYEHMGIGDIDGDGKLDIAGTAKNWLDVARDTSNNGNIGYEIKNIYTNFLSITTPSTLAIGDINNDGKPDIAISDQYFNKISIFRNKPKLSSNANLLDIKIGSMTLAPKFDTSILTYSGFLSYAINKATITPKAANAYAKIQIRINGGSYSSTKSDSTITLFPLLVGNNTVDIFVTSQDGINTKNYSIVVVKTTPPPSISSFFPTKGMIGDTISIKGSYFNTIASNNIVSFGMMKASVIFATDTVLMVSVPKSTRYAPISVLNKQNTLTAFSTKYFNPIYAPSKGSIETTDFDTSINLIGISDAQIADMDGDGKPDLVYNGGAIRRNTSNNSNISFAPPFSPNFNIGVIYNSNFVCSVADMDGDGKLDIITNYTDPRTEFFTVHRNTSTIGNLSFDNGTDIYVKNITGNNILINDFNFDGKADIIYKGNHKIFILPNACINGNIAFQERVEIDIPFNPINLISGDGDNVLDLVFVNWYFDYSTFQRYDDTIVFMRNTSRANDFTFTTSIIPTYNIMNMRLTDVDGDEKLDLLLTIPFGWNSVVSSILKNNSTNGNINFKQVADTIITTYNQNYGPIPIQLVGDLDGDGKLDMMISYSENYSNANNSFSVLQNITSNKKIQFANRTTFKTLNNLFGGDVGVTDFDGDGKQDIYIHQERPGNSDILLSIYRNISKQYPNINLSSLIIDSAELNQTFFSGIKSYTSSVINRISSIRIKPIAIDTNAIIEIRINNGGFISVKSGSFSIPLILKLGSNQIDIKLSIAGDTSKNIYSISITRILLPPPVITSFNPSSAVPGTWISIQGTNFGATTYSNEVYFGKVKAICATNNSNLINAQVPVGADCSNITVINTNSKLSCKSSKSFFPITIPHKLTSSAFDYGTKFRDTTGYLASKINIGDFDNDGKLDLATLNKKNNTIYFLKNISTIGSANFMLNSYIGLFDGAKNIVSTDIDNDGKLDLIVLKEGESQSIYINTSSSNNISFAPPIELYTIASPICATVNDFDGDGRSDIAFVNGSENVVSINLNKTINGTIYFSDNINFNTGLFPSQIKSGDMNGDIKNDIIVSNKNGNSVSVIINNSVPGILILADKMDFNTGSLPIDMAIGDVNGDTKLDIVTANNGSHTVSILKNLSSSSIINFAPNEDYNINSGAKSIDISNLNNDTTIEIVAINNNGKMTVINNNSSFGALSLSPKTDIDLDSIPSVISIADIDGDGNKDLVISNEIGNLFDVRLYYPILPEELFSLGVSKGDLIPTFSSKTVSYYDTVEFMASNISITPFAHDSNSTIQMRINGGVYSNTTSGVPSIPLNLLVGNNVIDVKISAQNGSIIKTYTVNVIRRSLSAPSNLFYTPNIITATKSVTNIMSIPNCLGDSIISYSIFPSLPSGLTMDTLTGIISGIANTLLPSTEYTITVSNAAGNTKTTLTITVNGIAPSNLIYIDSNIIAIRTITNVSISPTYFGDSITKFSITPKLPSGITIDSLTGLIKGIPKVLLPNTTFTITGINSGGSVSALIALTVLPIPPSNMKYTPSNYLSIKNNTNINATATYSGDAITNFSINPKLPSGVSINTTNGKISGVPIAKLVQTQFTITGTNTGGSTTAIFTLTVIDSTSSINNIDSKTFSNFYFIPNPFTNQVELNYISELKGEMKLVVTDAMGREVLNKSLPNGMGENSISIAEMNALQAGIYFAYLSSENAFSKAIKLIKE